MVKMLEPSKMTSKLFGNTTPRKNYCSNHKIPFSKHSGIMISNGWIEGEQIEEGSIPCPLMKQTRPIPQFIAQPPSCNISTPIKIPKSLMKSLKVVFRPALFLQYVNILSTTSAG